MSQIGTLLGEITARLQATTALDGIPVLLGRSHDLETDIQIAVSKMKTCIVVFHTRTRRREDAQPADPFYPLIDIEIYQTPLTAGSAAPDAADVAEAVATALDGWLRPTAPTASADDRCIAGDLVLVPDEEYVVWRVPVKTRIFL